MKLQNSSSDFSVYSTNGEQLAGELAGYQDLAHQIDKKRIVLYVQASGSAILFGTRLMVQIIGGREERAIFIRQYSSPEFSALKDRVRSFYDEAKARVESMARIKYRVLGLLKEGDIPIQERSTALSTIDAINGKILVQEPVKIKIEDLPLSFGVVKGIIGSFTQKNIPGYTLAIAQYPTDTDILISPNASGMDLEILSNGGERMQSGFEKNRPFFEAVAALYDQQRPALHTSTLQDRNTLSLLLKKSLLDSDIMNSILKRDPKDAQVILDVYRNDAGALHAIVKKILSGTKTLNGIQPEIITLVAGHIIESVKNPGFEDKEILKTGYHQGNDDLKNKIRQYLISEGIFEDYFLKDLVESSIKDGTIELLKSVVTSRRFNNQGLQALKNTIHLTNGDQNQVLAFIELMFASGFDTASGGRGRQIYLEVIDHYQQQHFNTRKLNQIQDRYGRPLDPPARQVDKKTIVISILFAIAIIGLVLSVLSYSGLLAFLPAGNQTTVNQTMNQTGIIRNASTTSVVSITILNGSYFEVNGTRTGGEELDRSLGMSSATSVRFIYNTTNETVLKSSLSENVTISDIIAQLANTT